MQSMDLDWQAELEECRKRFAKAHKVLGMRRRLPEHLEKPAWLLKSPSDRISQLFDASPAVFEEGVVTWGSVVQANSLLFKAGPSSCPADIVHPTSVESNVDPEQLREVAILLFNLKETKPDDPAQAEIAEHLTNEKTRLFAIEVPKGLNRGVSTGLNTTFFTRAYMPNAILRKTMTPIIVLQGRPMFALPLPARFWSPNLLKWWSGG